MMRKALYIGGGILLLIVLVIVFFRPSGVEEEERPISFMFIDLRRDAVSNIEVSGDEITIILKDGTSYVTRKEPGTNLFTILSDNNIFATGVIIEVKDQSDLSGWLGLVINFLPLIIFGGIIYALISAIRKIPRQ